jgi:micrococcal nuclease
MVFFMSKILQTCVLFLIIMAGINLSEIGFSGSIYSWTDSNGIKHFSNIAPPDQTPEHTTDQTPGHITVQTFQEDKFIVPQGYQFKVTKVFDGDTIQVEGSGLNFKIRLVGIDSPEIGRKKQKSQPYSQQAKELLARLADKKNIFVKQYGTGSYNRVLAEVFSGTTNINLEMVRLGLAEIYQGKPPKGLDSKAYFQAEKMAKQSMKGMWIQGSAYKSPRQWRKENPWK